MKLLVLPLQLTLVISLGSAFVLFPEDLSALLNVFYSGLPAPIRFGMNVTRVGVGFRLGRNVDFQTLVEMGSLITTSTTPPPRPTSKRNVRQQVASNGPRQPDTTTATPPRRNVRQQVTSEPNSRPNFINSLWSRRPAVRKPKPPEVTTKPPTDRPELPEHDDRDNEIES